MFNFFRKKPEPIPQKQEKPKETQKKSEPEMITFSQADNCFERAEKLFRAINFYDRGMLSNHMARGIQIYMDLDKQALESDTK